MRFKPPIAKKWALLYVAHYLMTSMVMTASSRKVVNFQPSVMSTDDVVSYFRSFFAKASSMDRTNEHFYMPEDYAEDLYHKIDNLMPMEDYARLLKKTKEITDKTNERKVSLLSKYGSFLNSPCNPTTMFSQTIPRILKIWDGDKSIVFHELEEWLRINERIQPYELCNRFRGLMCKYRRALDPDTDHGRTTEESGNATCQCGGDPSNVGFFRSPVRSFKAGIPQEGTMYPDGCYVRPWKPCKHLSNVDNVFKNSYEEWHGSLENQRRILAQMAFPVARTHRCKQGTYCLDLIPGMKKPVCWCNANSEDEECKSLAKNNNGSVGYVPPLGSQLINIRKSFARMIIPASETHRTCNPEYNAEIIQLIHKAGMDPTVSGALEIMKKLAFYGREIRICDFREALVCDANTRTCKGYMNCGPGKVHLGKGVCVSDNGYQCQSNEDCVQNARCTYFKEESDSACVCETGYGDECQLQHKPFFGMRFLPMVSGFQNQEYIQLQIEMYKVLESWEDSMRLKLGERCDPAHDKESMEIVEYFGNLNRYDQEQGGSLLLRAKKIKRDNIGQLCMYNQFQRCDAEQNRCVPFMGQKIVSKTDSKGMVTLMVEIDREKDCTPKMPKIFKDIVTVICKKGYACQFKGFQKMCAPDCSSPFAPKGACPDVKGRAVEGRERPGKVLNYEDDETPTDGGCEDDEECKEDGNEIEKDKCEGLPKGPECCERDQQNAKCEPRKNEDTGCDDDEECIDAPNPAVNPPANPCTTEPLGIECCTKSPKTPGCCTKYPDISGCDDQPNPPPPPPQDPCNEVPPGPDCKQAPTPPPNCDEEPNGPDCKTPPPPPPECPDPSNPKCEDPQPPPPPSPATGRFGSPCVVRDDCDASKFVDCSTSTHTHDTEGTCECIPGLLHSPIADACQIPYDELCKEGALDRLNALGYTLTQAPNCYKGDCTDNNAVHLCRPVDDDGAMFVSEAKLKRILEFRNNLGAHASCPRGPMTLILTFSLALWLLD